MDKNIKKKKKSQLLLPPFSSPPKASISFNYWKRQMKYWQNSWMFQSHVWTEFSFRMKFGVFFHFNIIFKSFGFLHISNEASNINHWQGHDKWAKGLLTSSGHACILSSTITWKGQWKSYVDFRLQSEQYRNLIRLKCCLKMICSQGTLNLRAFSQIVGCRCWRQWMNIMFIPLNMDPFLEIIFSMWASPCMRLSGTFRVNSPQLWSVAISLPAIIPFVAATTSI